jgi:hypothetical protein
MGPVFQFAAQVDDARPSLRAHLAHLELMPEISNKDPRVPNKRGTPQAIGAPRGPVMTMPKAALRKNSPRTIITQGRFGRSDDSGADGGTTPALNATNFNMRFPPDLNSVGAIRRPLRASTRDFCGEPLILVRTLSPCYLTAVALEV